MLPRHGQVYRLLFRNQSKCTNWLTTLQLFLAISVFRVTQIDLDTNIHAIIFCGDSLKISTKTIRSIVVMQQGLIKHGCHFN